MQRALIGVVALAALSCDGGTNRSSYVTPEPSPAVRMAADALDRAAGALVTHSTRAPLNATEVVRVANVLRQHAGILREYGGLGGEYLRDSVRSADQALTLATGIVAAGDPLYAAAPGDVRPEDAIATARRALDRIAAP